MKNDGQYFVFFDIDRTIVDMNSGFALGKAAYKQGMLRFPDIVNALFYAALYKLKLRSAEKMITGMGAWLKGLSAETVSMLANKAVNEYLIYSVYKNFRNELMFHNSHTAHTVFLTSAIRELCIPLSAHLGIRSIICTEMECDEGIYTGRPAGNYCYGIEKARRLEEFCRKHGVDLHTSFFYADSISDLPALELTGNPVCVNPDNELKKTATERGWRIEYWER